MSSYENVAFETWPLPGSPDVCPVLVQLSDKQERDLTGRIVGRFSQGDASLGWFAEPFALVEESKRKVVWKADLKPRYRGCMAEALMRVRNGRVIPADQSYIRLHFRGDEVSLVLDLAGRGPEAAVVARSVTYAGEPRWEWGPVPVPPAGR